MFSSAPVFHLTSLVPVSLVFNIGLETFAPAKSVNGSCVRTAKELQTSGGSAPGGGPAKRILPGLVRRWEMEKELFLA